MATPSSSAVDSVRLSRRVGLATAWASAFFGLLYLLGLGLNLLTSRSPYPSGEDVREVSAVTAILWNLVLLFLIAALRREAQPPREILAEIALAFAVLVCGTSVLAWSVALAAFRAFFFTLGTEITELMDIYNPGSLAYALEHVGWGLFFGAAAVCAGLAIDGGRASPLLRWSLILTGVLSLCHFAGVLTGSDALTNAGFISWGVTLPLSSVLLALMFRRRLAAMPPPSPRGTA